MKNGTNIFHFVYLLQQFQQISLRSGSLIFKRIQFGDGALHVSKRFEKL